jgi:hypothetical protein
VIKLNRANVGLPALSKKEALSSTLQGASRERAMVSFAPAQKIRQFIFIEWSDVGDHLVRSLGRKVFNRQRINRCRASDDVVAKSEA